jgi:predicted dehydrogenase
MVQDGKIGDRLLFVEANTYGGSRMGNKDWGWWYSRDHGGGLLGAVASHLFDQIVWVTNKKIVAVCALLNTFFTERKDAETGALKPCTADEYCSIQIRFSDGVIGLIHCSVTK